MKQITQFYQEKREANGTNLLKFFFGGNFKNVVLQQK